MKKIKAIVFIISLVCAVTILSRIFGIGPTAGVTWDEFLDGVQVEQDEAKVGAKIWLKEAIHGTEGINYRYIVKTDCPEWDYETRYMSRTSIEWVDETSAVEVLIQDDRISYDGTVYAWGQYYTIPILGGITSESVSVEEWEAGLIRQAYQGYLTQSRSTFTAWQKIILLSAIPAVFFLTVCVALCDANKKREEAEAGITAEYIKKKDEGEGAE